MDLQDEWVVEDGKVMRQHRVLRVSLFFLPAEVAQGASLSVPSFGKMFCIDFADPQDALDRVPSHRSDNHGAQVMRAGGRVRSRAAPGRRRG